MKSFNAFAVIMVSMVLFGSFAVVATSDTDAEGVTDQVPWLKAGDKWGMSVNEDISDVIDDMGDLEIPTGDGTSIKVSDIKSYLINTLKNEGVTIDQLDLDGYIKVAALSVVSDDALSMTQDESADMELTFILNGDFSKVMPAFDKDVNLKVTMKLSYVSNSDILFNENGELLSMKSDVSADFNLVVDTNLAIDTKTSEPTLNNKDPYEVSASLDTVVSVGFKDGVSFFEKDLFDGKTWSVTVAPKADISLNYNVDLSDNVMKLIEASGGEFDESDLKGDLKENTDMPSVKLNFKAVADGDGYVIYIVDLDKLIYQDSTIRGNVGAPAVTSATSYIPSELMVMSTSGPLSPFDYLGIDASEKFAMEPLTDEQADKIKADIDAIESPSEGNDMILIIAIIIVVILILLVISAIYIRSKKNA